MSGGFLYIVTIVLIWSIPSSAAIRGVGGSVVVYGSYNICVFGRSFMCKVLYVPLQKCRYIQI